MGPLLLGGGGACASPQNPPRLSYATYVGPASGSVVYGLAVDSAGYAYVSGGGGCAFVTKLNQTGTSVIWSVCLPVSEVHAVALDPAGYIYVASHQHGPPFAFPSSPHSMKISPAPPQNP